MHIPFFYVFKTSHFKNNSSLMKLNRLNKNISILGCGWYGLELAKSLIQKGYHVNGSSTTPDKLALMREIGIVPFEINFDEGLEVYKPEFFNCDVLFICIPPKRSSLQQHTFVSKIQRIITIATELNVKHVVFISSTSVYGDSNNTVTEETIPHPDTDSGKVILAAELLIKKHTEFTATIIRFGGLIGPGRDPGRFFAGKTAIPNGYAPVNLIHLSDCIGISIQLLETNQFGRIYNACSPQHPTRNAFYSNATKKSGMEPPQFLDELLNWKIISCENSEKYLKYDFSTNLL